MIHYQARDDAAEPTRSVRLVTRIVGRQSAGTVIGRRARSTFLSHDVKADTTYSAVEDTW